MAIDIGSAAVNSAILDARAAFGIGDFAAATLALQQAVDLQTAFLVDIAAAEVSQTALLADIKRGLTATVTLRDLLG